MGVYGMKLRAGDEIIGMQLAHQGETLLFVSEKGFGKRTRLSEFKVQNRAGIGLKCYKIVEKTGNLIGVKAVNDEHEIMMITDEGIIIQIAMTDVSIYGRDTSGVKRMNLDEGVHIAKIAKVRDDVADSGVEAEGEETDENPEIEDSPEAAETEGSEE